jgi:hypothetical protein
MEQEYEFAAQSRYAYFDRSYKVELAIFMIFGPVLLTLWVVAGYVSYVSGQILLPLVKLAAYSTITLICALILYGNMRAIRKAGAVVVGREQIVKRGAGGVSALNCADIRGVRWSGIPFINRWMTLESPQKSLRLPLYIRDGHEMVEKVFAILEERGGFPFAGAADLKARLCGAAKRFNVLHQLRAGHLPNLIRAATAAAIFSGGVAALFWDCTLLTTLIWGFVNMLFQAFAYFATEKLHVKKLLNGEDDGSFARSCALSGIIALLFGMAVFGMAVGVIVTEPV